MWFLSFVASVFDPLGKFARFTMRLRTLLTTICSKLCQLWDEEIPKVDKVCFEDWKSGNLIDDFREKNLFHLTFNFHSDVYLEAMFVFAYLRAKSHSGVEISLLIGNCRIALLKQDTLAKLELQAALCAMRLKQLNLENWKFTTQILGRCTIGQIFW